MGPCQKNKISLYFQFQLAPINLFPEKWGRQGKYMSCSPLCWYNIFFYCKVSFLYSSLQNIVNLERICHI